MAKFDWDPLKDEKNYRKHGVWFEEAQTIWVDPNSSEFFDPEHSQDEDRLIRLGCSAGICSWSFASVKTEAS